MLATSLQNHLIARGDCSQDFRWSGISIRSLNIVMEEE